MDTEDFSFPKISDTCACSIDSPPLWNISPKASSSPYQVLGERSKGDEAKLVSKSHKKCFSCVQNGKRITRVDDEEEPMDLLWEDFNEELSSATKCATSSSREMVEFRCTKPLTVAKTRSALLQTRNRPAVVVIVKIILYFKSLPWETPVLNHQVANSAALDQHRLTTSTDMEETGIILLLFDII
ncbi:hypothetical protein Fmac_023784 [Flemingia macrophylla]|uniref:Uncharacterized protein n=1 Tax=Flemingia macrophylla TaxID=520843 RepID=A0ABD1LMN5_9FABA